MKKIKIAAITFVAALTFSVSANAQKFSDLDKSPMDVAAFPSSYKDANKLVKVTYSRPMLKGRDLASLAPEGKVWRTGANEAAEITFYTPMMLGKSKIEPGTYSLFTIPNKGSWTVILNKATNVWGAYSYDENMDVARYRAEAMTRKDVVEAFSIAFDEADNGATMYMGWGNTIVSVPFTKADTMSTKMKK